MDEIIKTDSTETAPAAPAPAPVNVSTETTTSTAPMATTTDPHETAKPKTTAEDDRHSASQRQVNLKWENTQSALAMSIVLGAILASIGLLFFVSGDFQVTVFMFMTNIASNVIGFYFGRTNHQNVGGVQSGR